VALDRLRGHNAEINGKPTSDFVVLQILRCRTDLAWGRNRGTQSYEGDAEIAL
jgi:hypothetical protein